MAISYVGGVQGGRAGATTTTTQSLSATLTGGSNTSPSAGDLVVVWCASGADTTAAPAQSISGNNNGAYTALTEQSSVVATTYDTYSKASYKIQGGTVDTSITIPSSGSARNAQRWVVHVFRGVDSTTPMDVTATYATGTGTGRPNPALIAPTTAGAWICAFYASAAATGAAYTAPTDFATDWLGGTTADTADVMTGGGYYTGWTSGNYDPAAITAGGTTNAADTWTATTIALRPIPPDPLSINESESVTVTEDVSLLINTSLSINESESLTVTDTGTVSPPNSAPTVALNTPADAATGQSTTPDLLFTGTDTESDEIEYNVQVLKEIDSYDTAVSSFDGTLYAGSIDIRGQSFMANGEQIISAKFYLKKGGIGAAPTGSAYAKLYAHSGTFGTNGVPTGSVLATSEALDVSTLTTSYALTELTFSSPYTTSSSTPYFIVIEFDGGSSSNLVQVNGDTAATAPAGNGADYSTAWTARFDYKFFVYGIILDKLSATPDATFTGTGDPHPWPSGNQVTYTVQAGDTLDASTTYYWRARGLDPSGSNTYGAWSSTRSFETAAGGGTPTINKSESVTVSESRTVFKDSENINVSATVTVTESRKQEPENYINKSDSLAVTENLLREANNSISVSDSSTVTESLQRLVENYVSKSDTATVTETVSLYITDFFVTKSDTATLTESTKLETENRVSVSDNATVTDTPTVTIEVSADVSINKSDSVTVTENLDPEVENYIVKSDSATVTDTPTVIRDNLIVNVSDSTSLTESLQRLVENYVSKSDSTTLAESLQRLTENFISKSDATTVTESHTELIPDLFISKSDSTTLTESVTSFLPFYNVIKSESATVTESLGMLVTELFVTVVENASITENAIVSSGVQSFYNVITSDTATVTESVTINESDVLLNLTENITVTESVSKLVESNRAVSDTANVSESTTVQLNLEVTTSDTTTVTESKQLETTNRINVSENATVTENVSVSLPTTTWSINVNDTISGNNTARNYYIDSSGNVYWVVSQQLGLVEKI